MRGRLSLVRKSFANMAERTQRRQTWANCPLIEHDDYHLARISGLPGEMSKANLKFAASFPYLPCQPIQASGPTLFVVIAFLNATEAFVRQRHIR